MAAHDVATRVQVYLTDPRVIAALLGAPGQLGLARAYVSGDLDVTGDLYTAFDRLATAAILVDTIMGIDPQYPTIDPADAAKMGEMAAQLRAELPPEG